MQIRAGDIRCDEHIANNAACDCGRGPASGRSASPRGQAKRMRMHKKARNPAPPEGFRYQADILPLSEERDLVARIREFR